MFARLLDAFRPMAADQRGTVAVIFVLCAVPVIAIVSGAIDYGRAAKVRTLIQNAADAAVVAARAKLSAGDDEVSRTMRTNLDANLPDHLKGLPFKLTIASDRRSLDAELETTVPTTLMAMVGVAKVDIVVTSQATLPSTPTFAGRGQPSVQDVERAMDSLTRGIAGGGGNSGLPAQPAQLSDILRGMPSAPKLSPADIEKLQNSDEMRRAAAEMEARLRAAMQGQKHGGGMPDLSRLLAR